MSPKLHVAVVATRPAKNGAGRYLPIPQENVQFMSDVLGKADPEQYAALYHNATPRTVDDFVDDYAFTKGIRVKQFPAYWFNPTMPNNRDKRAGYFATESMLRALNDAVYGKAPEAETAVLVVFHDTVDPMADPQVKHAIDFATKKGIPFRALRLPVHTTESDEVPNPATTSVPF